jgi:hypothetical protein
MAGNWTWRCTTDIDQLGKHFFFSKREHARKRMATYGHVWLFVWMISRRYLEGLYKEGPFTYVVWLAFSRLQLCVRCNQTTVNFEFSNPVNRTRSIWQTLYRENS